MQVKGVSFTDKGVEGDFEHMIKNPRYSSTLFLFNENAKDFFEGSDHPGGGSAVVRPFAFLKQPKAFGIPTGWSVCTDGFSSFNTFVKAVIDHSFKKLDILLSSRRYDTVIFSCAKDDPTAIGTGIFEVEDSVRDYINLKLLSIGSNDKVEVPLTEDDMLAHAMLNHQLCVSVMKNRKLQKFHMQVHACVHELWMAKIRVNDLRVKEFAKNYYAMCVAHKNVLPLATEQKKRKLDS